MLNLDQCLAANRPLLFVVAESDIEVLQHLNDKHPEGKFFVYSSTLADLVPLKDLLSSKFVYRTKKPKSAVEIFEHIQSRAFSETNSKFETYIFLDAHGVSGDAQNIRFIKDIVTHYQLDDGFTVNLMMVSQFVCVPPALERLSEVVFFDLPSEAQLKDQSDYIANKLDLTGERAPSEEIVSNLKGLTTFEVGQAYLQSYSLHKGIDVNFVRDFKKSAIAKTDLLSLLETNVKFEDIGGMETLKAWVRKSAGGWTVEGRKFGLPLLKGILMVGLPGCGKTLISQAIGSEWGLPVVQFDPARVFSSRVGESESNIRRVLQIVEAVSPCCLFLDEIEKGFAGMQSSTFSDAGVTARVIGSFLVWLQECKKPVFTIATSNQIQYLPPELISRFDETFFVNLPQFKERQEIFKIHITKVGRDPNKFHLEQLAQASQDLSGREIEQAIRESMYDAFYSKVELSTEVIMRVLLKKTNLLTTMAEQLNYLLKWVGWNEEKQDGVRARFAAPPEDNGMTRVMEQVEALVKEIEQKPPEGKK
jgi:AAA+ superfamily predicted ATPase